MLETRGGKYHYLFRVEYFETAHHTYGLPRWLSGKAPACQFKRHRILEFDPWVEKIPWRREWQPTREFLPGKSCGQRTLAGSPWSHKESDKTEWLSMHTPSYTICMCHTAVGSTPCSQTLLLPQHINIHLIWAHFYAVGTQLETDILNEDANILAFSLLVDVFIASINVKPCILVLDGIEELAGIYGISGEKVISFQNNIHFIII